MKFTKITDLLIFLALILSLTVCSKTGTTSSQSSSSSGDWAVKIDDEVITMDEFNRFYYTQNKLALNLETNADVDKLAADPSSLRPEIKQTIIRKNFLDHLIAQKLIYKKAMNDKNVNRDELNTIIELSKLQLVGQYYLSVILKDKINVTQKDVDVFYQKNKSRFRHMPINEADMQIRRYLFLQQFKAKSNEYVMGLIAESKVNKEGFKNYEIKKSKMKRKDSDKEGKEKKTKE